MVQGVIQAAMHIVMRAVMQEKNCDSTQEIRVVNAVYKAAAETLA